MSFQEYILIAHWGENIITENTKNQEQEVVIRRFMGGNDI